MVKKRNDTLLFYLKLFLVPILYELVMGGGGRYLELGPLTFRMISFMMVMLMSTVFILYRKKIRIEVAFLLISFTIILFIGAVIGLTNGAQLSAILTDIKPLSFFYILLFFSLAINNIKDIKSIISIIKRGSILMAIIYITVIILILLNKINFVEFYNKQNEIGEIFFRVGPLFFYKGFIYLCVGFFFFLLIDGKYNKLAMLLLFVSILLTLTRGFILFTTLITFYYIFFINKKILIKYLAFFSIVAFSILLPVLLSLLGDKSGSDSVRIVQIEQVISRIDFVSLFIGHGFGIGTPIRPGAMEISFLEIFHKQGLIGVMFWIGLFLYIYFMYYKIKDKSYKRLALPFLLSVVFVVLQSTTNPYMNNPIGLSIILVTIVVFSRLLELQHKDGLIICKE